MFVSLQYGFHFPVPSFQNHCPRAHEKLGPSVSMSDDNEWFRKYFPLVTCKIGFVVVIGEVLLLDVSDESNAFSKSAEICTHIEIKTYNKPWFIISRNGALDNFICWNIWTSSVYIFLSFNFQLSIQLVKKSKPPCITLNSQYMSTLFLLTGRSTFIGACLSSGCIVHRRRRPHQFLSVSNRFRWKRVALG